MQLEQLIWMVTALGAFGAGVSLTLLASGRSRERGVAAVLALTGLLFVAGGFLLSTPRYSDTGFIAGGGALVGLVIGLVWSFAGRPQRSSRA
ncbi:hypothetical protein LO772_13050 [Yinghuangia sp. ASG 101]|uniref:hypothetical protein n=1 Tax=Yinghuangia sp. ASG 101 TaxID=2896848 RepID=UPI001E4897C9|nr:hypothetical protein [Yinghuangia sp. ASG 101]UGQ14429.1 hypothetical protein LO772_13050 [Yinghuangia sp. ASG 101]